MSISAVGVVYNEESRIEDCLKCFTWCDEIIIIDRNSTDRTREIASKYTKNIIIIENREFDPLNDNQVWLDLVSTKWVFGFTASDLLHPKLAKDISNLISDDQFPFDIIEVPFRRYILGINSERSPWHTISSSISVFKKDVYTINSKSVHSANAFISKRIYKLPKSDKYCLYHLTHPNVDQMMNRHLVYNRAEARLYPQDLSLKKAFLDIIKSIYHVIFRKKSFLMGWDGVALSIAYISYYCISFVYIWESKKPKFSVEYSKIKQNILYDWEKDHSK